MRKVITGGAGFIGSNYLRNQATEEPNVEFVIIDALSYAGSLSNLDGILNLPNVTFVKGRIEDMDFISSIILPGDVIVNFAAESHVDRSIESGYQFALSNYLGTQVLLDIAVRNKVSKFLQISTDEVYGSIELGEWDEDYPLRPNSPYSASKAGADLLALSYHRTHNLNVSITRCCNNYGPYQFPEKLIPFFIKRLTAGETIPVYGDGRNIREWIHVGDHCRAIELVLKNGLPGQVYNIGSGEHFSNLEIASRLLDLMQLPHSRIEFVPDRKGHDFRYSLNFEKIEKSFGYRPTISFEQGLVETLEWYSSTNSRK